MTAHEFTTIVCNHCGKAFRIPVYCGDRFCPVCNVPRLARVRDRIRHLLRKVRQTRELRLRMLTLTISSQDKLSDMIRSLVKSFRKYRSTPEWKNSVKGGCFVIEVTRNENLWHAHLHVVLVSTWLDFRVHQPIWMKISHGRGWYCKPIPPAQAIRYLTKYLTKPSVDLDFQPEVSDSISGFRLFQTFGNWIGGLKDYRKPEHFCPCCGKNNYLPFDILMRHLNYDRMPWDRAFGDMPDPESQFAQDLVEY